MKTYEVLCLRCRARHVFEDVNPRDTFMDFQCTICGLPIRTRVTLSSESGALVPRPETLASHRDTRQLPPPLPMIPSVDEPRSAPGVNGPLSLASSDHAGVVERSSSGQRVARACLLLCAPTLIVLGAGFLLFRLFGDPSNPTLRTLTRAEAEQVPPPPFEAISTPPGLIAELTTLPSLSLPVEDQPSEQEATQMLVEQLAPGETSATSVSPEQQRRLRSHKVSSRPTVLGSPLKESTAIAVLQKQGARLQRCADIHLAGSYRQQEIRVRLEVRLGGNGAVKTLLLSPAFLTTSDFGRCMTASIRHVQFPTHPGPDATLVLPVTLQVNRALHASR